MTNERIEQILAVLQSAKQKAREMRNYEAIAAYRDMQVLLDEHLESAKSDARLTDPVAAAIEQLTAEVRLLREVVAARLPAFAGPRIPADFPPLDIPPPPVLPVDLGGRGSMEVTSQ